MSAEALEVFSEVLQQKLEVIAAQAARIAKHSGRKTVSDEDIKLAFRQK